MLRSRVNTSLRHTRTRLCRSLNTLSPINQILRNEISQKGPISFAKYMQICLAHPTEGYYMKATNPVFGSTGDFITGPEISQLMGELMGIWLLSQWMVAGSPSAFRLVELGPGRGTLMDDMLRTISRFPSAKAALKHVHLVETSPSMRVLQSKKLHSYTDWGLSWHNSITEVPRSETEECYTMCVAHEFFDALPIHLIEKTSQGWAEILITDTPDAAKPTILKSSNILTSSTPYSLTTNLSDPPLPPPTTLASHLRPIRALNPTETSTILGFSSPRFNKLPVGSRVEVSPASHTVATQLGELLWSSSSSGGCGLIVDYGDDKAFGNSFRAFKDHRIDDPFHRPGECDLTANVDFAYLKEALTSNHPSIRTHGPIKQGTFLIGMGIGARLEALTKGLPTKERQEEVYMAADRLVSDSGMGGQYKFMGVTVGKGGEGGEVKEDAPWPFAGFEDP